MAKTSKKIVGVDFNKRAGKFRARKNGVFLGYFAKQKDAAAALTVTGVTRDTSRATNQYKVRNSGKHLGYFKTRSKAVRVALGLETPTKAKN